MDVSEIKLLKTMLIDVLDKGKASVVVIRNELEEYYRLLKCNYVESYRAVIGNKTFDIICDDEAKLHPNGTPSVINSDNQPVLINNVLICNRGYDGYTSLSDEDIELIKKQIFSGHAIDKDNNSKPIEVLKLYN